MIDVKHRSLYVSAVDITKETTSMERTPYIIDLHPKQGPISGGSPITLTGTNLNPLYSAIGALFRDNPDGCPTLYGTAQLNWRLDWKYILLLGYLKAP
jgi:IPT/TIG domain